MKKYSKPRGVIPKREGLNWRETPPPDPEDWGLILAAYIILSGLAIWHWHIY